MPAIEPLQKGEKAPSFDFYPQDGSSENSRNLKGRPFLVYFYPKDDTPGCTKEACAFRDSHPDFQALNVTVIGVSGDNKASHDKFRKKYDLPFALASDNTDFTLAKSFGVYGEKKFMGRIYDGIHRISFLIDENGEIFKTYLKVKTEVHALEVLEDIKKLHPAQPYV